MGIPCMHWGMMPKVEIIVPLLSYKHQIILAYLPLVLQFLALVFIIYSNKHSKYHFYIIIYIYGAELLISYIS